MPQVTIEDMPQVTIDNEVYSDTSKETKQQLEQVEDVVIDKKTEDNIIPPSDKIVGLSPEELKDPNKIQIEIAEKKAPIVVLFGQPACGKTMTLVRLTRFLFQNGYTVEPVKEFRPTYDTNYTEMCDDFNQMINQDDAAKTTSKISFMLVNVSKNNGKTICQILEAPGEYYFNPQVPNASFPRYFSAITSSPNRKIWCIFVEPSWGDLSDRNNYVSRIKSLKKKIKNSDRIIVVYNKIDQTSFLIDGDGNVAKKNAREDIKNRYSQLFDIFKETRPIISWLNPYRCEFVPFQTGDYPKAADGTKGFEQGPDAFPRRLWKIILKMVRG